MTEIGLVACSAKKRQVDIAPAQSLYSSPLFRKSAEYVRQRCDKWFILSAKHGVVWPNQLLEPYDQELEPATLQMWATMVRQQLNLVLADVSDPVLVVLAGRQYRSFLYPLHWKHTVPMQGFGVGDQLAWLTRQLRAGVAAS